MQDECKLAGFGGQGIMTVGKLLALAGLREGREVVWLPSYGPEMRGGTAYCTVVVADRPIGSPVINTPHHLIAMNRPSLEKFAPTVKPGGVLVINSSLIPIGAERNDIDVVRVPCNEIAIALDQPRLASMIALGAFVARSSMVAYEQLRAVVLDQFSRKPELAKLNATALDKGADVAREAPPFAAPAAPAVAAQTVGPERRSPLSDDAG